MTNETYPQNASDTECSPQYDVKSLQVLMDGLTLLQTQLKAHADWGQKLASGLKT